MFSGFLTDTRKRIETYLSDIPGKEFPGLPKIRNHSESPIEDLITYTLNGKMLRGALCRIGFELLSGEHDDRVTALGAAVELVQSAFLIHDDIMDRDTVRRGRPAMHAAWQNRAEEKGIPDSVHLGESLAICLGDLALFTAFGIIADTCGKDAGGITGLFSRDLSTVAGAQMLDTMYGAGWMEVSEEDILSLYINKTGRYTFAIPLSAGALLAGGAPGIRGKLERAGDLLGIAFQLKDDELGLFGDGQQLGKPVGSDVREGKKTLYYLRLKAAGSAAGKLPELFGKADTTEQEVLQIRKRIEDLGIHRDIAELARSRTGEALTIIRDLEGVREAPRKLLAELAEYNLVRAR